MIIPGTNYSTKQLPGTTGTSSSRYSLELYLVLFCDSIGSGLPSQGSGHVES